MMWSKGKKILAASSILKGKAQFKPFSSTMNSVMKYLDKDKNFAQVIKTPEGQSSNIKESRVRNYLYTNINQDDYIPLSPWHGLPLQPENAEPDVFQGLIEITRGTTAKMEVDTTDEYNPIVQDVKKDRESGKMVLRHYGVEPMFNYGMIP